MLTKLNLQIAKMVSKDTSRWSISGVHVTPNETVVTDGHRLVRVKNQEQGDFKPFNMKAHHALDAMKLAGKGTVTAKPDPSEERRILIDAGNTSMTCEVHDGIFPDYQRVIPKDDDTWVSVTFDAKLMKELMELHMAAGESVVMRFKPGSAGNPIIMETTLRCQNVQSLLMPMKYKKDEDVPPRY